MIRCNATRIAVAVALACATAAQSQDADVTEGPPKVEEGQTTDTPRGPLMQLFDKGGIGETLDKYGIKIGGWAEASVTFDLFADPEDDTLTGRAFDFEHADPTLNQIGLQIVKSVDSAKPWDCGFTFESIYGADGRFTASNGMDFQTGTSPENQFDITQAYVELVIPVGKGLTLKAGKWITPIGYEYVNPTLNPLYSHTYLFGIVPFSHTGVLGTYALTDTLSISLGVARGWEQSLEDNNGAVEAVFSVAGQYGDKWTYAFNGSVGPQVDDDDSHYRTMLDFWADYVCSDQLSLGVNLDYRYDSANASDGDASNTYGAAGYAKYKLNEYATLVGRLEWFEDTERLDGFDATIYDATLGVTITPFPNDAIGSNLKLRPEIRYDYATEAIYNDADDHGQLTLGLEGYFTF